MNRTEGHIYEYEIISVFRNILFVCDQESLIGRDAFAIDGVKLPSGALKQWRVNVRTLKRRCGSCNCAETSSN